MAEQPRTRRRSATLAVAGAVAAVLAFVVPLQASGGTLALAEDCAEAATAQTATVNIGLVVDFGDLKDASDPTRLRATCVGVAAGTNGVAMLQAAGHGVGMDSSGLLCSIDGLPADWQPGTRCGERTASGYRYWAYFHGTGSSWSYSSIGPAGYRAAAGTVEGWHFVEGAGNPSDPPPGRAPTNICPAAPPPTVAPTTAPPALPPPAPTTPATTSPPVPAGGATPTTAPGSATPGPTTSSTSAAAGAPAGAGTGEPGDTEEAGDDAPPGTGAGTGSSPGSTTIGADGVASDVTVLASAQAPPPGPGGAPTATVLAVVVVAIVGGSAAWRFRRRSDATP